MPTDNPKISLYVPQAIYDRFIQFKDERELSMSQAGIVILAEYFGLQETIKETTEGITIGGVTLDKIQKIEQRLDLVESNNSGSESNIIGELLNQVKELTNRLLVIESKLEQPINDNSSISLDAELIKDNLSDVLPESPESIEVNVLQCELLSEPLIEISPIMGKTLAKRFSISPSKLTTEKKDKTPESFREWTIELDPDNIGWEHKGKTIGYAPSDKLSSNQQTNLTKWIKENSVNNQ